MTRRALATFGLGTSAAQLEIALPSFAAYADRQGWDLVTESRGERTNRPASWLKIPTALDLFDSGYSEVFWIDADCVVMRPDASPWDHMPLEKTFGVVVHRRDNVDRPVSYLPNCGVLALRRACRPLLEHAWEMTEYIHHDWWEQAAVMSMLETAPRMASSLPTSVEQARNPWWPSVQMLPPVFNAWPHDIRWDRSHLRQRAVIRHAAGVKEGREELMREWERERRGD